MYSFIMSNTNGDELVLDRLSYNLRPEKYELKIIAPMDGHTAGYSGSVVIKVSTLSEIVLKKCKNILLCSFYTKRTTLLVHHVKENFQSNHYTD